MHRFISLDTETTGVDFCSSQVIQCGAIFLDTHMQPVFRKEWNVNYIPEKFSWNTEAEAIHGISEEDAKTHGLSPEQFFKELEQDVVRHYGADGDSELHIIAANAYFDYLMLDALWNEYRSDVELPFSRRVMDLSTLSLTVLGIAGMTSMLETLGIENQEDRRHSALYDAELHLKIFHALATIARQEGIVLPE